MSRRRSRARRRYIKAPSPWDPNANLPNEMRQAPWLAVLPQLARFGPPYTRAMAAAKPFSPVAIFMQKYGPRANVVPLMNAWSQKQAWMARMKAAVAARSVPHPIVPGPPPMPAYVPRDWRPTDLGVHDVPPGAVAPMPTAMSQRQASFQALLVDQDAEVERRIRQIYNGFQVETL